MSEEEVELDDIDFNDVIDAHEAEAEQNELE